MNITSSGGRFAVLFEKSSTVTADLVAEIKRSGGACRLFPLHQGSANTALEGYGSFSEFIRDLMLFEPDAVISINRKGSAGASAIVLLCELIGLPLISWYMDNPFYIPLKPWERDLDSLVFLNFDRYYVAPLKADGLRNVEFLPVGTNPAHFSPPPKNKKKYGQRPYPITFVGALGIARIQQMLVALERLMGELYRHLRSEVLREVEEGGRWQQANPRRMPFEYLDEIVAAGRPLAPFAADEEARRILAALIDFQATYQLRVEAAKRLLPLGLHVWGDDAWKMHLPADRFHGKAPWDQVQDIYRRSRLVLNITRYQIFECFTQRFLDVPMCGSVLISDDRLQIGEWFTDGEDLLLFRDADDLAAKVESALAEPDRLEAMAERAREKVLAQHTYGNRVPGLNEIVRRCRERIEARGEADFERQRGLAQLADAVFEQFVQAGDLESLRRMLEAARPANCDHPDWLAWRAALAFESGNVDEAVAYLNRTLVEDPNQRVARYYLALIVLQRGKPALAAETARKLAADYPQCERCRALHRKIGHMEMKRPADVRATSSNVTSRSSGEASTQSAAEMLRISA